MLRIQSTPRIWREVINFMFDYFTKLKKKRGSVVDLEYMDVSSLLLRKFRRGKWYITSGYLLLKHTAHTDDTFTHMHWHTIFILSQSISIHLHFEIKLWRGVEQSQPLMCLSLGWLWRRVAHCKPRNMFSNFQWPSVWMIMFHCNISSATLHFLPLPYLLCKA
jgi:hypothetical protein